MKSRFLFKHNELDFEFGWTRFLAEYESAKFNFFSYDYSLDYHAKSADGSVLSQIFYTDFGPSANQLNINYTSYSWTDVLGYLGGLFSALSGFMSFFVKPIAEA